MAFASGSKRRRRWLIRAGAVFFTVFCAAAVFVVKLLGSDRIYHGISIEGVQVSKATREEAYERIKAHLNSLYGNVSIPLRYGDNYWLVGLKDISYAFLIDKALAEAFEHGRNGNPFQRIRTLAGLLFEPVDVRVESDFDADRLKKTLEDIGAIIQSDKKDASVDFVDGNIRFISHVTGRKLDVEKSMEIIKKSLMERVFEAVDIVVEVTEPDITIDNVNEINGIVSSFSTNFSTAAVNRSHNIKTACEKISGTVIMPGQVFSMDKALGPRTKENGYLEAPVIIKNELVDDIGGGICQVTTTLYNTALLAGMDIVERTHHSWPLEYVSAGRDATIAEGSIDFKFRNNTEYAMCVNAYTKGGTMTIEMWGKTGDRKIRYNIKTELIEIYNPPKEEIIIDNSLPDGVVIIDVKGRTGRKVAVYREMLNEKGEVINREVVSIDIYRPVRQVSRTNGKTGKISEKDGKEGLDEGGSDNTEKEQDVNKEEDSTGEEDTGTGENKEKGPNDGEDAITKIMLGV
jgi:vancomycin resistance protein YoaR